MLVRTLTAAAATAGAVVLCLSGVAAAESTSPRVGPDQVFRALVNGRTGSPSPVTIAMACYGPLQPGQTGHPVAGQSVKILLGGGNVATAGFTGATAVSVGVFFGPPPPSAAVPALLSLTRYGVARAISTSLRLPCAGGGQVTFVPLPMSPPTSRAVVVPVSYVGQP